LLFQFFSYSLIKMNEEQYPKEFLELLQSITNKRARVVIDHIMKYGSITTEELELTYGYNHPPRAARDVREAGIPLETVKVKSKEGRSIAAYKFGDLRQLQSNRITGRILFSKEFKAKLFALNKGKCSICYGVFEERYLQADHRVPYEVSGDLNDWVEKDFMLLCGSCNRAKSWSCEHCENWKKVKDPLICMTCYWGSPESYNHMALAEIRRLDIQWSGKEVSDYDAIKLIADQNGLTLPEFVKKIFANKLK
jgi:hypothetical protein